MINTKKMGVVITLLVSSLTVSSSANAFTFVTYTNETAFRSAAGTLSRETFNSFTTDTSFNNGATVNLTDFSLTGIGNATGFLSGRNNIDVPPLLFSQLNINGTPILNGLTANGMVLQPME